MTLSEDYSKFYSKKELDQLIPICKDSELIEFLLLFQLLQEQYKL